LGFVIHHQNVLLAHNANLVSKGKANIRDTPKFSVGSRPDSRLLLNFEL
jgi:hypothetical protein